jgi:hypothetical protein
VSVVCCQVEVSATGWSLVQRSPTDCGVSECDRETSTKRGGPGPYRAVEPYKKEKKLDEGGWSTPRPGRFILGKETEYPLYRRLGGPQGRSGWLRKISPLPGFDPRTVQPVKSRYTD